LHKGGRAQILHLNFKHDSSFVSFEDNMGQATHEAVMFLAEDKITRQMHFSEFEALLEGFSAVPEYKDEDARAAYVVINGHGKITSLVFFEIYFDEDGRADASWNIPVEKLASISAKGPDLGSGPIRLACRSQCAINWHQGDLWDPDMNPGTNHFLRIKQSVDENRLRLKFEVEEDEIPILSASVSAVTDPDLQIRAETDKRVKLARLLKEQRLRIRTLEAHKEQSGEVSDREQRIITHAYKNEIQNLNQQIEQFKVTNEKLQKKLSSRNDQYLDLQDKVSDQFAKVDQLESALQNASASDRDAIEKQKLEAELVLLREQLDRRDLDLAYRDDREEQLRAELEELKETQMQADSASTVFEQLKSLEVVFVAYHAGVGHLSMTATEAITYAANPLAYAASKCFVTESQYKQWLAHFDNPVCTHTDASGCTCHETIEKVSVPSEFEPGISDRCSLHA
jgi:hypothetical protein